MGKYKEYSGLDLNQIDRDIQSFWEKEDIFNKSIDNRPKDNAYVFYEGPPSANGKPGIHHVMGRTVKDLFCRFNTMKGYRVERKGGWDTHGLPIELSVEKELGITKEDIGNKISVDEYNAKCRETVMRYKDLWDSITRKMGYWVDLDDPYITFKNEYIESVWWLLSQLYQKELLYKGYTIQPYSPAAGTGLSTHELNQPGAYRDVTDTTVTAQFEAITDTLPESLQGYGKIALLAWTTTPWTLPSNTALTVGPKIDYVLVQSFNQYTFEPIKVILAKNLLDKLFSGKYTLAENENELRNYSKEQKKIPYIVLETIKGEDLVGIKYHQLLPYATPFENPKNAFRVIAGDFVTTEDGTGIVHTAPTFGADDARAAKMATPEVPPMLVKNEEGKLVPLVDLQGKFRANLPEIGGKYVKNEYYKDGEAPEKSVDVEIAIKLKIENKAFKVEKYVHNYPHCWRTDKPVLYYPLDSWFVKATAAKKRMVELNNTINWHPAHTGEKRFGNWLENLQDWNLSRSRYWGIPLPIWRTEDKKEEICIGSVAELNQTMEQANKTLGLNQQPLKDLHRPYIDEVVLVSPSGKPMHRELDLIDVWFDSGSMPYAQWHYPFENKDKIDNRSAFPANFIAEGVDQTRGWFYTLHAIATMVFDSVAYKNVVSNGLVLDKNGVKMSKRLGNVIDPFETIEKYGADATRWYMISNAPPWDNLKFDLDGVDEVRRKFFGTLYNTYSFFTLYANIDGFDFSKPYIKVEERPEIDRWILSSLNQMVKEVDEALQNYDPTVATRKIMSFVDEHLSNWYVRLNRRRFWKGEYTSDKEAAYQTLYECLEVISKLMAPVAPFFADWMYQNLNQVSGHNSSESVHLCDFPSYDVDIIDPELNQRMEYAQKTSSLVHSLRKKENIRVRQPLTRILLPVLDENFGAQIESVKSLILAETNVKDIELITDTDGIVNKKAKPNFKTLGRRLGPHMKTASQIISGLDQSQISEIEKSGNYDLVVGDETFSLTLEDFDIITEDIPGWQVAQDGALTVALDVTLNEDLLDEGLSKEIVNRIQNLRKESGFGVTDRIIVHIKKDEEVSRCIQKHGTYIKMEVLADDIILSDQVDGHEVELREGTHTIINVTKS
jgi:isoleucyl-tRNA synthetase